MPKKARVKQRSGGPAIKRLPDENLPSSADGNDNNQTARHTKTEENIERSMRRAQLWSIPAYLRTPEPQGVPITAKAMDSFRDVNMRARTRTQERQMQHAQSLQGLQRRERPIRRINCRLRIPGTDMVHYVHNAKTYHCPDGIEPWLSKNRWMLEPDRNIFRRFDSKVPFVDHEVYHHYTEDPLCP